MIAKIEHLSGISDQILTQISRIGVSLALTFVLSLNGFAQTSESGAAKDSLWTIDMPVVVITATKTEISLRDVPVPTKVLLANQIKKRATQVVDGIFQSS